MIIDIKRVRRVIDALNDHKLQFVTPCSSGHYDCIETLLDNEEISYDLIQLLKYYAPDNINAVKTPVPDVLIPLLDKITEAADRWEESRDD